MGTLTATENQQLQQAKVTANQANAEGVNKMTKDQQLTWAQNNMQSYGNTAQAAVFAQKLQDPAELAKFKAMSPAQKMAYLQANGVAPANGALPAPPANNAVADAQAKQQKMQQDLNNYQAGQYTGTLEALLNGSQPALAADAQQKLLAMNNAYTGCWLSTGERTVLIGTGCRQLRLYRTGRGQECHRIFSRAGHHPGAGWTVGDLPEPDLPI